MPFLDWVNKNQAKETTKQVPYHLLEHQQAFGDTNEATNNLLIQGDNLLALKALTPFYSGKVKCIFIDPPYNTQSAFEHYDDKLEHSQWLSMMYSRMQLLKELLTDTGSIFIQLDDNESDYFKILLDEIFGRKNFINRITLDVRSPSAFSTVNKGVFKASEYLLWYAKDKTKINIPKLRVKRNPDYAYDKWIENPQEAPNKWRIISVNQAFLTLVSNRSDKPEKLIEQYNKFIVTHAAHIIRFASISDKKAGKDIVDLKYQSIALPDKILTLERKLLDDVYILNGEQIIFYSKNISSIDEELTASRLLTNIWEDIAWEGIAKEGNVIFNQGKKPEKLIKRCLELTTHDNDLVLDSFLGSGTTAAVAHKMGRHYIGIEMGEHAKTHCIPRLEKVIEGEQGGISKTVNWQGGGGFSFYTLGQPVFDDHGAINPHIQFATLAAYIWHFETGTPAQQTFTTPLLGVYDGVAYYLLYNGILGDRRPAGGNVLTHSILEMLQKQYPHQGKIVIYGESSRIGKARLDKEQITFKQTPYDIKIR